MAGSTLMDSSGKKVRKPYTITKSRESWSDEEHDKFLEALHMFGRDWRKIEDYVGSKSVIQIRSHAQKYFLKIQKNGVISHVPPPRPKRKATHPYPQKAMKNASMVHPSTLCYVAPRLSQWDDSATLMNTASNGSIFSQDEHTYLYSFEDLADISSAAVGSLGNKIYSFSGSSNITLPNYDMPKQDSLFQGFPNFAELYSFIGSVFDPDAKGHLQKLKQMNSVNLKTVLLLMRNLTINLSTHSFEPNGSIASTNDVNHKVGDTTGFISPNHNGYYLPSILAGN